MQLSFSESTVESLQKYREARNAYVSGPHSDQSLACAVANNYQVALEALAYAVLCEADFQVPVVEGAALGSQHRERKPLPLNLTPENADLAFAILTGYLRTKSTEPDLRIAAARAIGNAGGDKALVELRAFLRTQESAPAQVKEAAILAIGHLLGKAHS